MAATILAEDTDKGLADARGGLARLCLATGEVKPVEEMIRYVIAPDGTIVPDLSKKLPGRGAWVSGSRAALQSAIEKKAFARAFRGKGKADAELPLLVERLLMRAALDSLSLANKAGQVVAGFEKVKERLTGNRVLALLHASNAAEAGRAKLNAAAKSSGREPREIRLFSGEQLDLALGRSNVVHAALLDHAVCRAFLANCLRCQRWREQGPRGMNRFDRGRGDQE
ncbi:MAG TPA: RNA-binding protein [Xanthobacteraceae bacterium]|nr:RNA-binding protein [Xanthobacteraceae bacterium]